MTRPTKTWPIAAGSLAAIMWNNPKPLYSVQEILEALKEAGFERTREQFLRYILANRDRFPKRSREQNALMISKGFAKSRAQRKNTEAHLRNVRQYHRKKAKFAEALQAQENQ